MSAHTCSASSSLVSSSAQPFQQVLGRSAESASAAVAAGPAPQARVTAGPLANLVAVFRQWRVKRRMRNLAADMDPHIMQDVGVPDWLVNETTVQRELSRMRNADYMRW